MRNSLPLYIVVACVLCTPSCKKKDCTGSSGIFVRVLDSSNKQPLPLFLLYYPNLDSISTKNSNRSIIPPDSNSRYILDGRYPLIDDSYLPVLAGKTEI